MSTSLIDILIRPDAFFSNAVTEKESLKIPALIILTGGIIAAITGYLMGGLSAKMMAEVMPGLDAVILLSAMAGAFVGIFIVWLIAAGIFYLVSALLKGQGSFNRVLEVVGYGYLPQIAGSIKRWRLNFKTCTRIGSGSKKMEAKIWSSRMSKGYSREQGKKVCARKWRS